LFVLLQLFSDVLHALVFEGADVSIPLSAIGTGNILLCEVRPVPS